MISPHSCTLERGEGNDRLPVDAKVLLGTAAGGPARFTADVADSLKRSTTRVLRPVSLAFVCFLLLTVAAAADEVVERNRDTSTPGSATERESLVSDTQR
jgi:hypothetical protein